MPLRRVYNESDMIIDGHLKYKVDVPNIKGDNEDVQEQEGIVLELKVPTS
jgi:hypothetical protein